MKLAVRDHKIFQMKAELENRKKMLCAKRRELKKSTKENELLTEVMRDYDQYNNHLISQKKKQIDFLQQLNQYIDTITHELNLTTNKLEESKHEQRDIIKEINLLKEELDDLVKYDSSNENEV